MGRLITDPLRVLYAEDDAADADLTAIHFEQSAREFELEIASTGRACLARLHEREFDVLLLDNHLPDMDGIDVLRELISNDISVPVVMVTAAGDEELVVQVLRLGARDFVPKHGNYIPRLPAVLKNAVTEYRRLRDQGDVPRLRQRRILYVEHNPADIDLTLKHFSDAAPHFTVDVARFSSETLSLLGERGYDLILVDLRMPDMNALELLNETKHRGHTVPFIVTTGKGDEEAAVAALKLGAYDYIIKREDYLTQLPYAIDNAIARSQLIEMNRRLQQELAERERAQAENIRLEEQLRQSQKMESIGRLAGGVAHDFNNLLTVIYGYADLTISELAPEDPLALRMAEIKKAGDRASALTRQLLALSRRQLLQPRVLALNSLITNSTQMLHRLLGEDIELVLNLEPNLAPVKADPGQVDQVILNLSVNARDAMPRGGRLTVGTRNATISDAEGHVSVPPGSYVALTISDNGTGMDATTLSQIFEPFFTTKAQGEGTGLGLATVYGIVKQSGGSITVHSKPGQGTTFEIYLPRIDEPVGETQEDKPADIESPRGTETILVVEDEELVRELTCIALRRYGYQVIEAASPGEALLFCEKKQGPIPLMVTDVVMPQMSGPELASRLHRLHPEMKVLFMSGYTDDAVVRSGLQDTSMQFLQKPFSPSALARKVREILGS